MLEGLLVVLVLVHCYIVVRCTSEYFDYRDSVSAVSNTRVGTCFGTGTGTTTSPPPVQYNYL